MNHQLTDDVRNQLLFMHAGFEQQVQHFLVIRTVLMVITVMFAIASVVMWIVVATHKDTTEDDKKSKEKLRISTIAVSSVTGVLILATMMYALTQKPDESKKMM